MSYWRAEAGSKTKVGDGGREEIDLEIKEVVKSEVGEGGWKLTNESIKVHIMFTKILMNKISTLIITCLPIYTIPLPHNHASLVLALALAHTFSLHLFVSWDASHTIIHAINASVHYMNLCGSVELEC